MVRYESAHLVICDYFGWGEVGEFEGWLAEIGGCDGGWSILVNKSIPYLSYPCNSLETRQ